MKLNDVLMTMLDDTYFEVTKNKQGDYGFRFGTRKAKEYIRFDKTDIDDTNIG